MELKFAGWIDFQKCPEKNIKDLNDIIDIDKDERQKIWYKVHKKIKEEIIKFKYQFSGEYHQYGECGCPVFEIDGKLGYVLYSMRAWGEVMAECWDDIEQKSKYDYLDFYMTPDKKDSKHALVELEYYKLEKAIDET